MRYIFFGCLFALSALFFDRANAGSITYIEASAFEESLRSNATPTPKIPEILYTQPANKVEPCKLPTSQDQLDRNNFRAFWDGKCRSGYAYGLGRDIAISDTHHVEEITIHSGGKDDYKAPAVTYDFVNNLVSYVVRGERYPEATLLTEEIRNGFSEFDIQYVAKVVDASGSTVGVRTSPFNPQKIFINYDGRVLYTFRDNSSAPVVDPSAPIFIAEILDPTTNKAGGVAVVGYVNGQFRHFRVNGDQKEEVRLPAEYISHFQEKYESALRAQEVVSSSIGRVKKIEREYLHMACNGMHSIKGLKKEISTKICTWRDQFKAPYQEALNKYTENIGRAKQRAEAVKQQSMEQQASQYRAEAMKQQEAVNQQMQYERLMQQIQQTGQTFQNIGQQFLQQSQQYSAPQVQSIEPQGAYGGTTYRRVGNTVLGSDGSSCQVVGQGILCSDGKRCQMVGDSVFCN